jgi:uncharacterized phage protein (TIGR02220 family)
MYTQRAFFDAIKAFAGQGNMIVVPSELIKFLDNINAALLLSQLIYWSDKGGKDGWIYKTYAEWEQEIHLNEYHVRKAVRLLENKGFLATKIKKANGNPTVHYRVKWDTFSDSFLQYLQERNCKIYRIEPANFEETLTETTTETTSKTTSIKDIPFDRIIKHLNQKCGTNFRSSSQVTKKLIQARWNEGFRLDDFLTVIDKKSAEWLNTSMAEYLRPQTLFGTKFEAYLNTPVGGGKSGRTTQVQEDGGRKVTVTGNQVGRIRTKEL